MEAATVRAYSPPRQGTAAVARPPRLSQNVPMSSDPPAASIRFATRADALGIAEMSRDFIEHGLGWSWTRERILQQPAPSRHQRHRRRARSRPRRLRDHEVRRRGSAPAAARGQAVASALRRRQRAGRVARALGAGRRRRPHHARGARQQRRRARLLLVASATRRRSCCPATTAVARRACGWSRPSACREPARCERRLRAARRCSRSRRRWPRRSRLRRVPIDARPLPLAAKRVAGERRRMRGLAARAGLRALGRGATTCAAFESFLHAGTVFNVATADAERGRDAVVQSWAEIVEGRTDRTALAAGHRRRSAASRTIAVSRGPYILQTMQGRRASVYRVGMFQTVWVRDANDAVWRVLFDGSATPRSRSTIALPPTAGSRTSRCRTARSADGRSGADHAALEHAAVGAAVGGIEPPGCRAAAARRWRGRAPRWRGRATRAAPRPGRSAVARRLRRAGGSGPLLAASENWLTALASARCSSAACRSMPAGSRARSALPSADEAGLDRGQARFELRRVRRADASTAAISPAPW